MSALLDTQEFLDLRMNFILSAKEKLDSIEGLILTAEAQKNLSKNKEVLKEILSLTHSIKGASRSYKFDGMALFCNKLEDYIVDIINHDKIVSAEELTKLLKFTDFLINYCEEFILNKKINDQEYQVQFQKTFGTTPIAPDLSKRIVLSHIKIHILAVGINSTIMKQVYMALVNYNYNISFAADPLEAFHRIAIEKYDLIISSYVMDPIDGISFSLALKNQWHEKAPKLILLASEEIKIHHAKELMPDKIFIKSLSLPQELFNYFETEFNMFSKEKMPKSAIEKRKVKSIYFVEDDENILDLFLMIFTEQKDVVIFNEVTKFDPYERIVQLNPDLIICDIHVPNMDTMALLIKIKTSEELSKVPVVFFTGDPDQPIAKELIKRGALAVLDKTIILTSMLDELEKLGIELQPNA